MLTPRFCDLKLSDKELRKYKRLNMKILVNPPAQKFINERTRECSLDSRGRAINRGNSVLRPFATEGLRFPNSLADVALE